MPNCAHWLGNEPPVMPLLRRHPGCTDPPLGLFYHEGSWHVAHAHTLQASFLQARAAVLIDTEKRVFPFYGALHELVHSMSDAFQSAKISPGARMLLTFHGFLRYLDSSPGQSQVLTSQLWLFFNGKEEALTLPLKHWEMVNPSNSQKPGNLAGFPINSRGPWVVLPSILRGPPRIDFAASSPQARLEPHATASQKFVVLSLHTLPRDRVE